MPEDSARPEMLTGLILKVARSDRVGRYMPFGVLKRLGAFQSQVTVVKKPLC